MSERRPIPGLNPEITRDQMNRLIDLARSLAPYHGQPIDDSGVYQTVIEHADGEGYVSIYVPTLADMVTTNPYIDDTLRIVNRREAELPNGITIVDMTAFGIRLSEMTSVFYTDSQAYDSDSGEIVRGSLPSRSVSEIISDYDMYKFVTGPDYITQERLNDVQVLLESFR